MNVALIFAGGTGTRMSKTAKPKQFLDLNGKAIIVHTILNFEKHRGIDAIAVVCLEDWLGYLAGLLEEERMRKVKWIVPGGATGQESIYNGLKAIYSECKDPQNTIVLINDGVRPLVAERIITANLECVRKNGTSVTVAPVPETVLEVDGTGKVDWIPVRSKCMLAKAPQGFILEDIMQAHIKAIAEGKLDCTNSAELMFYYGHSIYTIEDSPENIKITTPVDFYVYKSIVDTRERMQILGVSG